jgi:hypothetical protein
MTVTPQQFNQFLAAVVIVCAFGAMLNISKLQTRGASAKYLATAFCTLGLAVFLIRIGAKQIFVALAGGATFGLLAADFAYRLRKLPKDGQK